MKKLALLACLLLAGCTAPSADEMDWLELKQACDFEFNAQPIPCEGNVADLEVTDSLGLGWLCVRATSVNDQTYQVWMNAQDGRYAMRVLDPVDQPYFGLVTEGSTASYDWSARPGQFAIIPADLGFGSSAVAKMFNLEMSSSIPLVDGVASVDHVDTAAGPKQIFHVVGNQTYHFSVLRDESIPGKISMWHVDYEWVDFVLPAGTVHFEMTGINEIPLAGLLNPGGCLAD